MSGQQPPQQQQQPSPSLPCTLPLQRATDSPRGIVDDHRVDPSPAASTTSQVLPQDASTLLAAATGGAVAGSYSSDIVSVVQAVPYQPLELHHQQHHQILQQQHLQQQHQLVQQEQTQALHPELHHRLVQHQQQQQRQQEQQSLSLSRHDDQQPCSSDQLLLPSHISYQSHQPQSSPQSVALQLFGGSQQEQQQQQQIQTIHLPQFVQRPLQSSTLWSTATVDEDETARPSGDCVEVGESLASSCSSSFPLLVSASVSPTPVLSSLAIPAIIPSTSSVSVSFTSDSAPFDSAISAFPVEKVAAASSVVAAAAAAAATITASSSSSSSSQEASAIRVAPNVGGTACSSSSRSSSSGGGGGLLGLHVGPLSHADAAGSSCLSSALTPPSSVAATNVAGIHLSARQQLPALHHHQSALQAPPSPDELGAAAAAAGSIVVSDVAGGDPSSLEEAALSSVGHMALSIVPHHNPSALLPYVDELDFLASAASSPGGGGGGAMVGGVLGSCSLGVVGSDDNSVDSFLSSQGVSLSRLPPVSSLIKIESPPPTSSLSTVSVHQQDPTASGIADLETHSVTGQQHHRSHGYVTQDAVGLDLVHSVFGNAGGDERLQTAEAASSSQHSSESQLQASERQHSHQDEWSPGCLGSVTSTGSRPSSLLLKFQQQSHLSHQPCASSSVEAGTDFLSKAQPDELHLFGQHLIKSDQTDPTNLQQFVSPDLLLHGQLVPPIGSDRHSIGITEQHIVKASTEQQQQQQQLLRGHLAAGVRDHGCGSGVPQMVAESGHTVASGASAVGGSRSAAGGSAGSSGRRRKAISHIQQQQAAGPSSASSGDRVAAAASGHHLTQAAESATASTAKQHVCPVCGKVLATRNVYQLHMRSHSGEKPFRCDQCGNKFSQKTSLTRHFRSHTGERPFPCEVCGKRFADKERIKIHMRTHTGEKPFSCDVCGKRFSQKSTVKRHMSVHTGAKPFQCATCGKGFANRGNLNAHAKTHGVQGGGTSVAASSSTAGSAAATAGSAPAVDTSGDENGSGRKSTPVASTPVGTATSVHDKPATSTAQQHTLPGSSVT